MGLFSSVTDIFKPSTNHVGTNELFPDSMQPAVKELMNNIPNLQTPQYYQGQQVANQNPWQRNSLENMYNYGAPGGQGSQIANAQAFGGGVGMDAMGQGYDYLGGMNARGPNEFQYDQGTYDQAFGNLSGGMQNQFDLGARNIQQGFDWNMLPGLNMQNALGGGQGSTKFGQQGALGQAMANQNIQQFGSDLWSNAANQANQNAMTGGSQNLASANNFDNSMMQNYGNYAQLGAGLLQNSTGTSADNFRMQNLAGNQQMNIAQQRIDANKRKWDFNQNAPWMDQAQRQNLTSQWVNPGAIQTGASPFQQGLDTAVGVAGLASGMPTGSWGGGGSNIYAGSEAQERSGNQDWFFN